jgi:hypothetical protein
MKYPRQNHPELPYWAARKLEHIADRLADMVMLPEQDGERFAQAVRATMKELAAIRRLIIDRGILDVELEEQH